MALNIDLDQDNAEEMEKQMAAGGVVPPCRYLAFLQDAIDETEAGGKTVSKLTFELADGAFAGRRIKVTVFHEGKDAEATKICALHLRRYMKRLGVMEEYQKPDGTKGHRYCDGIAGFEDVIGNECVLDVINRAEDKFDPQTGQNVLTGRVFNDVKMHGIYTVKEAEELAKKEAEKAAKAPAATGGRRGRAANATPPASNGAGGNAREPVGAGASASTVNTDGL